MSERNAEQVKFEKLQGMIYAVHVSLLALAFVFLYFPPLQFLSFPIILTVGIAALMQVSLTWVSRVISKRVVEAQVTLTKLVFSEFDSMKKGLNQSVTEAMEGMKMPDMAGIQIDAKALADSIAPILVPAFQESFAMTIKGMKGAESKQLANVAKELAAVFEGTEVESLLEDAANGDQFAQQTITLAKTLGGLANRYSESNPAISAQLSSVGELLPALHLIRKQRASQSRPQQRGVQVVDSGSKGPTR